MPEVRKIEPTVTVLKPRKRVAAYARISMDSDRLNHSLSAQISYFSELIQRNPEWIYVGVYADSGISGGDIRRRAEFQRLIDDCNARRIDIVLCKSISRFARSTVDLLETVRHLKTIGVEVRFEKENIHTLSSDGELLLSILAGFAEEESRSQSENAKWAIRKKFERGQQWHVAAYGYRWNGETFLICEEEAKAVRVIFDNFLKDVPLGRTAKWLKENGHACSIPFIHYVLENPVYIGDVILQRYFTENPRTHKIFKNTGQLPRYLVTDNHAPIIERETFEKVQEKIKASYEFNPAAHRIVKPSCFSAKIICSKCGAHFVKGVTKTNRHDGLQEHTEGWNISDISRELESKGYQSIRGRFSRRVVTTVLDSDFYIGNRTIKGQFTESGVDAIYMVDGVFEPLVSKEDFDKTQEIRKQRAEQSCNRNPVFMPFSGMVKCGCCGGGFSRRTAGKYRRWGCNTRERKGRESCDSRPIKEEELVAAVRTVMEKDDFDAAELRRKGSKIVIHGDRIDFHLVNGRIKKTARIYNGQRGSNPFTNKVYCASCGSKCERDTWPKGTKLWSCSQPCTKCRLRRLSESELKEAAESLFGDGYEGKIVQNVERITISDDEVIFHLKEGGAYRWQRQCG